MAHFATRGAQDLRLARRCSFAEHDSVGAVADRIVAVGQFVALLGVVLVLLSIGGLKFTQIEIDGLKPIIEPTPWLAWMYPAFGEAGASYLLGVVELATAFLLMLSPWSVRAGVVGGRDRPHTGNGRRAASRGGCAGARRVVE